MHYVSLVNKKICSAQLLALFVLFFLFLCFYCTLLYWALAILWIDFVFIMLMTMAHVFAFSAKRCKLNGYILCHSVTLRELNWTSLIRQREQWQKSVLQRCWCPCHWRRLLFKWCSASLYISLLRLQSRVASYFASLFHFVWFFNCNHSKLNEAHLLRVI